MRLRLNKFVDSNTATIFMFLYGIIIQAVALPAIYFYNLIYQDTTAVYEKLVFIWFCIPIISVLAILTATYQVAFKRKNNEKWEIPLIGLILNFLWFAGYLVILYVVFVVKAFPYLI